MLCEVCDAHVSPRFTEQDVQWMNANANANANALL